MRQPLSCLRYCICLLYTSLGKEQAINLGVDYDRCIRRLLLGVTLFIAVATAMVGPCLLYTSHPGNVKIRGGKIIWIDMGMMGRLTERDRELIGNAVEGIAMSDIGMIQDAVMALGDFKEPPDQSCLYEGISNLLSQYGTADMGSIDIAKVTMSLMEVMKENKIIMPHGLTTVSYTHRCV